MELSKITAGCMRWGSWGAAFDTKQYLQIIESCVDMGITSFDHADIYGHYTTEAEFGEALKYLSIRKEIQIVTKCGIKMISPNRPLHTIKSYDCSAEHIITSVENSLKNLQTDYIDVLLLHRPDILLNPNEVASAFDQLKQQGKVLSFGVSNFSVSQMQLLQSATEISYNQIELSPLCLEPFTNGVLDYCLQHKITVMAWSPLKGGAIYNNEKIKEAIQTLAKKYDCSADSIAYAWLLQHPANINPITGTSRVDRLKDAIKATTIKLLVEDWYLVYTAALGNEVA